MKRMRTLLALILALLMTAVSACALAELGSGTCGKNLTWHLDDEGTLTISGSGEMADYRASLITPWYALRTSVLSVVLKEGVTRIGSYAFSDCSRLTVVTIPASVISIGSSAFSGCSSLTAVTISASVTSIGNYAFYGCTQAEITLPDGVTSIGSGAFDNVKRIFCNPQTDTTKALYSASMSYRYHMAAYPAFQLYDSKTDTVLTAYTGIGPEVEIPQDITCIDNYAFSKNKKITSVIIPESVMRIGIMSFWGCSALENVTIPTSVTSIGDSAFLECGSLEEVMLPSGLTRIEANAFNRCSSLTSLTIPENVVSVGVAAFFGCTQAEITLPDGITSIGSDAFYDVKRIICNPQTETSRALSGYHYFQPGYMEFELRESDGTVSVAAYTGSTEMVLIPPRVMQWSPDTAFTSLCLPTTLDADCSFTLTATNVTVPDGVTSLGTLVLTNVQKFYLPDSVQNLDGLTIFGTKPVIYCSAGSTAQAWATFSGYETCTDGWGDECTLRYPGTLALDVGESIALRWTDFVISPIPVDYRGEMTLESADLAVDGLTITALTPGDATVTATLDGRYTTSVPVHVYRPVERIALKAPSLCKAGQSFTVTVEELAPEDVSGRLIWIQDGTQAYEGTGTSLTLTAPEGQNSTVIRVTAPGGARSEAVVRIPTTISAPYLRSGTVELGSLVGICVDVDGETLADDPQTYGTVELGSAAAGLTLEDGVVRATGLGTVTFRVKGLSGNWVYLTVTVQDMQHAYRTQFPATPATCGMPGNTAYGICRGCGRFFNAEGKEIEEGSWVLPVTHVHHLAGGSACRDCGQTFSTTGLNVMTLPTALRVIRDEAFASVTAQGIVVPTNCETVGECSFAGCTALQCIFLPAALEERIPNNAFVGCDPELDIIFR